MDYLYIATFFALQICFFLQLYYILVIHQKLASFKIDEPAEIVENPVTIIICARNELHNLQKNLIPILSQDHNDFEVIVVNDCSNDGSNWFLQDLAVEYANLKVVTINDHPRFKHGKKFAATLGIKASKNENMIFTDADCVPASDQWLKMMQSNFKGNTEIVLGYSPYERRGGILNRFIRFETFYTALNYLSFALSGIPYMGVGRNMGYKKSLFFKGKGFASHMHILSGDDDLFVNQNATSLNTRIEIHPKSHVWTEPKRTFSEFISQKLRHQGAGKAYKREHKKMLSLLAGSGFLFYVFLIVMLVIQAQWWLIAGIYLIRLTVQLIVYTPVFKKLNYPDLIWWLPVFDFIYYFYVMALSFITLIKKRVEWK